MLGPSPERPRSAAAQCHGHHAPERDPRSTGGRSQVRRSTRGTLPDHGWRTKKRPPASAGGRFVSCDPDGPPGYFFLVTVMVERSMVTPGTPGAVISVLTTPVPWRTPWTNSE